MKYIVLGNGLLGAEIVKQTKWNFLSRSQGFNALEFNSWSNELDSYDTIINCIACTDTYGSDRDEHWNLNVKFVDALAAYANTHAKKLVHISTDYIYTNSVTEASEIDVPVHLNTWYGYSKLIGDAIVQLRCDNHLICRLSHKPVPFPYNKAWQDIKTNCDGVDIIASLVIELIYKNAIGIINVGTNIKSIYDLALKTNNNVLPIERPNNVPADISMNITKLKIYVS